MLAVVEGQFAGSLTVCIRESAGPINVRELVYSNFPQRVGNGSGAIRLIGYRVFVDPARKLSAERIFIPIVGISCVLISKFICYANKGINL